MTERIGFLSRFAKYQVSTHYGDQFMFCNQCEQTLKGVACTDIGVCGKDPDMQSLQEILLYGVKGMAAYAHHARRLGAVDESINAFIEDALFATVTNVNFDLESLLELVLECGQKNLVAMKLLNDAHVARYGTPTPTTVYEGTKAGPGILITGHDMLDLEDLLKQTEGTGVNVYTHGEMLPAHMYPELKKYKHLVGHFGGAWQNQKREFLEFGGAVLATTNCVLIPPEKYKDRLFTTRVTAVPGATRLKDNDFSAVIECAKSLAPLNDKKVKESTIGFHKDVLLGAAGPIVDAVKAGNISHFFVIGGCDGAELGRNYFSDFAKATPESSLILTLGCGKFRIRNNDYGTMNLEGVGEIPRLLDMGQCNDAYGAIEVAVALANAFDCSVNDLPLTIVLSWFEQKAVAVLLTLLSLGVKGIRIGPNPPAFVSPNVLKILQDSYDLKLTNGDPKADLAESLS
jgi:hydroxylamine reductase